jgi:cytochrome b6-f complex iron-sulfur subunit
MSDETLPRPLAQPAAAPAASAVCPRRDFVVGGAWALLAATGATGLGASVRLLYPRARFDPASQLVLGRPEELALAPGEVCERWKQSHRLILVREPRGFHALRAVCTHLGCIPSWQPALRQLRCPCHGSAFRADGVQIDGPAPRPLERLKLFLDEEGRLVVDLAVRYRRERGEWERDGAFLATERKRGV